MKSFMYEEQKTSNASLLSQPDYDYGILKNHLAQTIITMIVKKSSVTELESKYYICKMTLLRLREFLAFGQNDFGDNSFRIMD